MSSEAGAPRSEVDEALDYAYRRFRYRLNRWFMTKVIEESDRERARMAEQNHSLSVHEAKRHAIRTLVQAYPAYFDDKGKYSSAAGHVFALRKGKKPKAHAETKGPDSGTNFYSMTAARTEGFRHQDD